MSPSVLFVCLGNICRSPTAEAVFRQKAADAGLSVKVDSAGTHGYHIGKQPDKRSQQVGLDRGYQFDGLACRRVCEQDYRDFDYIIAMDHDNARNLREQCPDEFQHKIHLFMAFANSEYDEVPDPYYGGKRGFELVLDLIEQASDGLIKQLQK